MSVFAERRRKAEDPTTGRSCNNAHFLNPQSVAIPLRIRPVYCSKRRCPSKPEDRPIAVCLGAGGGYENWGVLADPSHTIDLRMTLAYRCRHPLEYNARRLCKWF